MRSKVRGKCFIINNVEFKSKTCQRVGSDVDAKNIKSLFTDLHFDVVQKDDLTSKV